MKNTLMLKRIAAITLVLFSLFLILDLALDSDAKRPPPKRKKKSSQTQSSPPSDSSSSDSSSSDSSSSDSSSSDSSSSEKKPKEPQTELVISGNVSSGTNVSSSTGCSSSHVSVSGSLGVEKGGKKQGELRGSHTQDTKGNTQTTIGFQIRIPLGGKKKK